MTELLITFPKPEEAWSINQDRKIHWSARSRLKKAWKHTAWGYAIQAKGTAHPGFTHLDPSLIRVLIPFSKAGRRDPHNYTGTVVKAIIDGLVLAGFWPDDTAEWVEVADPVLIIDSDALVQIHIIPKGDVAA